MQRGRFKSIMILGVIVLALYSLYPTIRWYGLLPEGASRLTQEKRDSLKHKAIHLGLDLQGGMHLVLEADLSKLSKAEKKGAVDRALEIIRNRVDRFGVSEPSIQREGKNRIIVQLPGIKDPQRAIDIIGRTALLEFKLVDDDSKRLRQAQAGQVPNGYELRTLAREDDQGVIHEEQLLLTKRASLTGRVLKDAVVRIGEYGNPYVALSFKPEGTRIFDRLTGANVGRRLAIVLDEKVQSAPIIRERISGGQAQITGSFTVDEANDLALVLRAGALPAPVNIIENRTVGPSLGRDSIAKGIKATIIGLVLVALFMVAYYRLSGLLADIGLFLTLIILLGALAGFHATLTLPGIAGIILTIGMAVDANVLIFERIREEIASGKTIRRAIDAGYAKASLTIMDANVTTLIAALVLFQFGTGPIKGFAVTLSIGILASMFSALVVCRAIFDFLASRRKFAKLAMAKLFGQARLNFISIRRFAFAISFILIVVGLATFAVRGQKNFGLDFTGGSLVQLKFAKPISAEEGRRALKEIGLAESIIQQFDKDRGIIVRSYKDAARPIIDKFTRGFEVEEVQRQEMVGAVVGRDLRKAALLALGFAMIGVLIYISWRFEFMFACAAIIALFHDVLITVGILAISGKELNLPIIAAFLTIVGYSLNDTIVVFDRIRENLKLTSKMAYQEIINQSINQTLSRTLLTSLTTLVVVLGLFFMGGEVIHDFAFAMIVGILVGTYSSVFVASPILVEWKRRKR